jgi:hypothetical protein
MPNISAPHVSHIQEYVQSATGNNVRKVVWRAIRGDIGVLVDDLSESLCRRDNDNVLTANLETINITIFASPCGEPVVRVRKDQGIVIEKHTGSTQESEGRYGCSRVAV